MGKTTTPDVVAAEPVDDAQAGADAAAEQDTSLAAALPTPGDDREQAELDAQAATGNAPHPPAEPVVSVAPIDLSVGTYVGFGATCIGDEHGVHAVDPETGCITGPYEPPADA